MELVTFGPIVVHSFCGSLPISLFSQLIQLLIQCTLMHVFKSVVSFRQHESNFDPFEVVFVKFNNSCSSL